MALTLPAAMAAFRPALPGAVAYSGGADSTALLLAAARAWPGQVQAIHVHHGLQAAADDFERHCRRVCQSLGVPLHVVKVDARSGPGESPEDAARRARYAALARTAAGQGLRGVWLAQHADDQVETMLLALSRGAGLPGLAAMPARFVRHGMPFERPFLAVSGVAIREWLAAQAAPIAFIEDPTNADTSVTRNRIRLDVVPALQRAFPQFRETFARSARHAAQAQELLGVLAAEDLARAGNPPSIAVLRGMETARQANVLRHWLRHAHDAHATTAQLDELLRQLAACATRGHDIRIRVGTGLIERNGPSLRYLPGAGEGPVPVGR